MAARDEMVTILSPIKDNLLNQYITLSTLNGFDEDTFVNNVVDLLNSIQDLQTKVLNVATASLAADSPQQATPMVQALNTPDLTTFNTSLATLNSFILGLLPSPPSPPASPASASNQKVIDALRPQATFIREKRDTLISGGGSIDETSYNKENDLIGIARRIYLEQLIDSSVQADFMDSIECNLKNSDINNSTASNFISTITAARNWIETKTLPVFA